MLLFNLLKHASRAQAMKRRSIALAREYPLSERVSRAPHRSKHYFHFSTFSSLPVLAESLPHKGEKNIFLSKNPSKTYPPCFLFQSIPEVHYVTWQA
jgi:hypothetical protein